MSFCTSCGHAIENDAEFCTGCGTRAKGSERFGLAAFLDTETTGLAEEDEVIELSIALFEFDRTTGTLVRSVASYTGLREPSRPIDPGAQAVHGIDWRAVRGRSLDKERVRGMLVRAEFLVAHNAAFDRPHVERLFPEAKSKPWKCSMTGIDWRGKGFGGRGLQKLLQAHGISSGKAHRAEADVKGALKLLGHVNRDGSSYLAELMLQIH